MRDVTIARNYAEALLELARRAGDLGGWGQLLDGLVSAVQRDRTLYLFLESPRVSAEQKNHILARALEGQLPHTMVRFLEALVMHRRQMLLPDVAREYHDLVDQVEGRMHASVTVARAPDDAGRQDIAARLSQAFGKEVVPHFLVNESILGGVVVRVGDTVLDGSVRRRLSNLRTRMLAGRRG
ncbi:MAG TPA: F0F1 ATP synthase subunit delta [Gemmatimonadaceae bacterium]|nr:F0F1 ATP synthase subunit delta [Gemmatimonadaceae bacterium]